MARPDKVEAIKELKDNIENNSIAIATKYQGITVAEVTELRTKLREQNIKFKVYKNTLAKRALDELGLSDAAEFMEGPTAWAFSEDPVAPAKVLKNFGAEVEVVSMQGAILRGELLTKEQLQSLADLPSREELLAQVVGTIAMPMRNLVGALSAVPRNMVNVVEQIRKQKEESEAA